MGTYTLETKVLKIVNRFNLPQPFVDAVSFDDYDSHGSDYTTTGLLRPPRITQLTKQHWDSLETDASDLVWRMSGQVKHIILERIAAMNPERYITEKRFYLDIAGKKVSGQIDLYDREEHHLYDWKETGIWKVQQGDKDDWTAQANINRLLMVEDGRFCENEFQVDALTNIAFMKDWKTREAQTAKREYPECAIQACPLPLWPLEKTRAFVEERIRLHEAAKIELPLCSPEERWLRGEHWAVMRKGLKKALKRYDSEDEALAAQKWHSESDPKHKFRVEHRPGESVRCQYFCQVSTKCSQFREMMMEAAA